MKEDAKRGAAKNVHSGHRKRMRERFLEKGMDSFSPHEVVEVLLYQIIPFKDTNELAHELINKYGSLAGILNASKEELIKFPNIGESGAVFLNMLPEFFRVYQRDLLKKTPALACVRDILNFVVPLLNNTVAEEVLAVCTDGKKRYINMKMIRRGSPTKVDLSVREIVQYALNNRANGVILAHSHPGGAAEPSEQDERFTKTLYEALLALDMVLLEHIIVTKDNYYSFFIGGKIAEFKESYEKRAGNALSQAMEGLSE